MRRRFLGIPVPVISAVLCLVIVGGVALAWSIMKPIPATVMVLGGDITLYEDYTCTTELTELDFGELEQGVTSDRIMLYVENTGDYTAYIGLSTIDLDEELTLEETISLSIVPADSDILSPVVDWSTIPVGVSKPVGFELTASQSCARGAKPFTLQFHAQGDPFP